MKRIVWLGIAPLLILTGCDTPATAPTPTEFSTQEIYAFSFSVEQLSGEDSHQWESVYTYNGETIPVIMDSSIRTEEEKT